MLKLATKFAPQTAHFETAYQAGYRFAEFFLNESLLEDWEAIADLARQFPMEYVLHFPNDKGLADQHLECAVKLHRALDCRAMVIHRPMLELYEQPLRALDEDLELAVENHRLTPDELQTWGLSNRGLTLDVEHLWKFTLDDCPLEELLANVAGLLEQFGDKLLHVHMPGYRPGGREHQPMYFNRDMVFGVFTRMAEANYRGFIVSEVHLDYQTHNDLLMDLLMFHTWRRRERTRAGSNELPAKTAS